MRIVSRDADRRLDRRIRMLRGFPHCDWRARLPGSLDRLLARAGRLATAKGASSLCFANPDCPQRRDESRRGKLESLRHKTTGAAGFPADNEDLLG